MDRRYQPVAAREDVVRRHRNASNFARGNPAPHCRAAQHHCRNVVKWLVIHTPEGLLRGELPMAEPLVQALDAALTSPHRSTKPTRPLSPSSLRHLALQVVYVALSIRRAFLVDSFAATVQDVKRLQRALQDVLSPTLINSSWLAFVLVDYSHQPMGDEAAGQVFLVNRTLVQQGLQYETSASSERLAIVDVSPSHGASPRLLVSAFLSRERLEHQVDRRIPAVSCRKHRP